MSSAKDTRLGTETFPEACPTTPLPKSRDIVTSSRTLTLVAVSASHSTNYRELAKGRHCRLIGACIGHSGASKAGNGKVLPSRLQTGIRMGNRTSPAKSRAKSTVSGCSLAPLRSSADYVQL